MRFNNQLKSAGNGNATATIGATAVMASAAPIIQVTIAIGVSRFAALPVSGVAGTIATIVARMTARPASLSVPE